MYDILIKNANIVDGTGILPYKSDLAIKDGLIEDIGLNINPKKSPTVIDANNMMVTPGFIDIQNHSDSYWTLFDQPDQLSMLVQGITTIVIGNCGSSVAPLTTPESIKTIQKWHNLSGVNVNWTSFKEFLHVLSNMRLGPNVASLVGHATLRRGLIGDQARKSTPDEIKVMERLLEQSLSEGGFGLSLGLVYAHEVDSTTDELESLAKLLKNPGKYLSVHLRSESSKILESVDEVVELAARCKISVKISHLKVRGQANWHFFDHVINHLENAYHQGIDISFDVYPYDSSWSVLYTYLPRWSYEGGRKEILRRLNTDTDRRKILDYLKEQKFDYRSMIVASANNSSGFIGKNLDEIAINQGTSNEEALLNTITATDAQVIVFDHNLSMEQVELFASSPLSLIATDGAGYSTEAGSLIHPRCFGTMPAFLKLVRQKKILRWEQAVKKITSEPARLLGIKDRGVIAKKMFADINIFNPETIADHATYLDPYQLPVGISHVIVNGKLAVENNKMQGQWGKVISR